MLHQAKYLTAAVLLEQALQMLLPIYLVRALTPHDFASYRFLALMLATSTVVLAAAMPSSLQYFLPRHQPAEKAGYVGQTILFMGAMGLLATGLLAAAVAGLPPAGPLALLPPEHLPVYILVALHFTALPIDSLLIARGEIRGQAAVSAASAVVRVATVAAGATFGTIEAVCWSLVVVSVLRILALLVYVGWTMDLRDALRLRWSRLRDQLHYAVPFGIGNAFYSLRSQSEQWIAAALLSPTEYASVSIAAVITPLVVMLRISISRSIVSSLQKLAHENRFDEMLALNTRANIVAASMLVPLIAFVFAFADELVVIIYTERYAAAADVMRVICIGLLSFCVEYLSLNRCFRVGRKVATFDGALLVFSVLVSSYLGHRIGLQGVVVGSSLGLFLGALFGLRLAMLQTGRPLARMQDWGATGGYLLAGASAAASSMSILGWMRPEHSIWWAMAAAVPVFAIVYVVVLRLVGQDLIPDRRTPPVKTGEPVPPTAGDTVTNAP